MERHFLHVDFFVFSFFFFFQCRGVLFRVFGGEGTFFGEEDDDD